MISFVCSGLLLPPGSWLMGNRGRDSSTSEASGKATLSPRCSSGSQCSLHWLFNKVCSVGALTPIQLPTSLLQVTLYADDVALFISLSHFDIEVTKQIQYSLGIAPGLCANLAKSVVYPICCYRMDIEVLLNQFPGPIMQFPCKYLGLLMICMIFIDVYMLSNVVFQSPNCLN